MEHPRAVDMNLVNAQQARRILDRLVGYRLSPFISQKIRRGLSAGRVQSVAVRMIVDREEEIRAFKPEEYWTIDAKFTAPSRKVFSASLYGDENGKIKIENKEQSDAILSRLDGASYTVKTLKRARGRRTPRRPLPPPPSSRRLRGSSVSRLRRPCAPRRSSMRASMFRASARQVL